MFKKLQNHLLLHHPLLWNLKIVPVLAIGIALHFIFFMVGYIDGAVDFTRNYGDYLYDITPAIAVFFSIITGLFLFIIWIVFYFRNNAFKAFYPKGRNDLYKEWLLILVVCALNCTYALTFTYACDLKKRNYFTEEEFSRRIDIISMASVFADGSFLKGEYYEEYSKELDSTLQKHRTTYPYFGKEYPLNSLLNKSNSNFTYQSSEKDSLNETRVKGWLHNNQRDSVAWLLHEMDKIVKYHTLKSSITPHEWLSRVYNPPLYTKYTTIGRVERYELTGYDHPTNTRTYNYDEMDTVPVDDAPFKPAQDTAIIPKGRFYVYNGPNGRETIDLTENTVRTIDSTIYVFPKYYVPFSQLEESYTILSEAWVNPDADIYMVILYGCFCVALSLIVFSFRVTSGRNWLIALVAYGLASLVTGIFCLIIGNSHILGYHSSFIRNYLYFMLWLVIVTVLLIYFFTKKDKKGISGVVVNVLLWLTPAVLPVIILLVTEWYDDWYDRYYNSFVKPEAMAEPKNAIFVFIYDNPGYIFLLCLGAFIVYMYFFTNSIRKWKGLAEA
ncbi:hypothetical protein ACLI09_05090 [Flavobacterium sp. RHBU_24]|uniref:hypothetical protein n=1 Tax=Flavobacterium sp. RHBU_24 TaxID=3391185 RepID=UPI003984C018